MEELLPSEVARLILGFLKANKCEKSWEIFLEECSDLYEYSLLYKRGKLYSTNVNGKSLLEILKEYCILKNASEKYSSFENFSESVCNEKVKVILEENVRNAVEQVIQKYLPCFSRKSHHRCDLLTDATPIDHTCDHNPDKSTELENEAEKMDESNNTVILQKNTSKETLNDSGSSAQLKSTVCDINSLTEEVIPKSLCKLDRLDHNLQLVENPVPGRIFMQDIIKVEKDTENYTFLNHKTGDVCSKNTEINCHTPSTDSENIMLLHSTENNTVAVENFDKVVSTKINEKHKTIKSCKPTQTNDCFPGELEQAIKVEPDSSINSINQTEDSYSSQDNSTVTHAEGNRNSLAETNETAFCSIQSTSGSVNYVANPVNLMNSHSGYAIDPFTSHSQSLPVSNLSYSTLPTYFVQNCPSNSSLLQNNSPYSIIIKTPATRTATTFPLAIPGILPNSSGPTLTSVTSLSSQNQPCVLSTGNKASSNMNAAADSTNTCGKSQTDSTVVLNSICKAAEALFVAPTKTGKNVLLKSNLLTQKSGQKNNCSKKRNVNNCRQRPRKKKSKYENLAEWHMKQGEITVKRICS